MEDSLPSDTVRQERPRFPDQAVALYQAGRRQEAEFICSETVRHEPSNFEALHMLGALQSQRGDWPHALTHFARAAQLDDQNAFVHNNLGLALLALGRPLDASNHFRRATALLPSFAEAHCNLGSVLDELGRDDEALECTQTAIGLQPRLARAHSNRGSLLQKRRRLDEALRSYDQAIGLAPDYATAHAKRGALLMEMGRSSEALASFSRALGADSNDPLAYVNRSALYETLARFEDSLADAERATALRPDSAIAHNARGTALVRLGRHVEALESFRRAMQLDARLAEARSNAGFCLLRLGQLREGWKLHEWRKRLPRPVAFRALPAREWTADEPLQGQTLLLYAEQGLGDTIHFSRYATLAARAGARVLLEVPAALKELLSSVEGVEQVLALGEPLPAFDRFCALLSLPLAFDTTLDDIPRRTPYLRCEASRVQQWRERLGVRRGLRVGLVWAGGARPEQPDLSATYARRNVPLALLACLKHPEIEFYSVQKGTAAEQELAAARGSGWDGPEIQDLAPLLHDFSDTAAVIENLDLLISVDTSTAHLAGALGKAVWIPLCFDGCWRWLHGRDDSPWYPTAKLYRQPSPGDWDAAMQAVRRDLFALASQPRT